MNTDGTLSRISNWADMTDAEKEQTKRIIGRRNQKRIMELRAQGKGVTMDGQDVGIAEEEAGRKAQKEL